MNLGKGINDFSSDWQGSLSHKSENSKDLQIGKEKLTNIHALIITISDSWLKKEYGSLLLEYSRT